MRVELRTIMAGPEGNHNPGDIIDDPDGDLVKGGYAIALEEVLKAPKAPGAKGEETVFPKHKGFGVYELSNGEEVKGKKAALEAEKALEGGDENGTQTDNGTDTGSGDSTGNEGIPQS